MLGQHVAGSTALGGFRPQTPSSEDLHCAVVPHRQTYQFPASRHSSVKRSNHCVVGRRTNFERADIAVPIDDISRRTWRCHAGLVAVLCDNRSLIKENDC